MPSTKPLTSVTGIVVAALVAVALAILGPTPRHAEAQPPEPNFAPNLQVRVPHVDPDGNGSVLAGATLNVAYSRVGTDTACTASASEQLTVAAGSLGYGDTAQPPNPRVVSLNSLETDGTTPCRYTANFDDSFEHTDGATTHGPYGITSGDDATFTVDTERLTAAYSNDQLFFPTFTFAVPQTADPGSGDNTYANGVLRAAVAVADGPTAGGCTASATGDGSFNIDFTATATGTLGTAPHQPAMLIDVPEGETTSCVYTVTLDEEITSPEGTSPTWTLYAQDHPTLTVSAAALTHQLAYHTSQPAASSTFEPDVAISVPSQDSGFDDGTNWFERRRLVVRFVRSGGPMQGCSDPADTATTYQVHSTRVNFGASVRPNGGAPRLINVPKYETTSCVYEVQFPSSVSGNPRLLRTTINLDTETQASDTAATATYHAEETTFFPDYEFFDLPFVDEDGDNNNDLAGTTITISLSPKVTVPPQNAGCTPTGQATPIIGSERNFDDHGTLSGMTASAPSRLVNRPMGEDRQCIYIAHVSDITFGTHRPWAVVTNDVDYRPGDGFLVTFQLARTTFAPAVTIEVPQYNGDGANSARNAYAGRTIDVSFTRTSGPVAECSINESETYAIQDDGSVDPQDGTDPVLTHQPAGLPSVCEYSVTYDPTVGTDPVLNLNTEPANVDTTTSDADKATRAKYDAAQTSFSPSLAWQVPFTDGTDAGTDNDFNGQTITVDYARVRGADTRCTAAEQELYTVGPGGSASAGGVVTGPTAPVTLVDRPAGEATRCEYTVDVSDAITPTGGEAVDVVDGDDNQEITGGKTLTIRYSVDTFFTPAVTITVPQYDRDGAAGTNWYAGTRFGVTFTAKPGQGPLSGCLTVTKNYVVGSTGTVAPQDGAPVLVDVPLGQPLRCVYVAQLDTSVSSTSGATPAWTLRTQSAATQDVSNANPAAGSATAEWAFDADAISFAPTVTVTVPQIVGLTAGENLFDGQTFEVMIARAATPSQHDECSLSAPLTVTFTVDATGTATASTLPASLVDRPQGETMRCTYTVTFPPTATSAADAELTWTLAPDSTTATLAAGTAQSASATGAYDTSVAVTYDPDISIMSPPYNADDDKDTPADESAQNAFTGVQLRVPFVSAALSCTDVTMTFTVQANGSAMADDPTATLVAYPARTETLCAYTATFDPNEVGGTNLVRQPGATGTVTGIAQTVSVTYHAIESTFMPALTWRVPFIDGSDGGTDNDFDGQAITVDYARKAGAHTSCTQARQETYTVGPGGAPNDGGEVSGPTAPVTLVDRPAGRNERCVYVVDVANSITSSGGDVVNIGEGSDNQEITGGGPLTVRFPGGTTFTPTVTITVPQYDRDGAAATNWYEGTTFLVTFTARPGSPSGCLTVTKRYVVGTSGAVVPDGGAPALVDVPLGKTASCAYAAELDASVSSTPGSTPAWTLRTQQATTQNVSNADAAGGSATVEWGFDADAIMFVPTVAITVPPVEGLAAGVNLFAGTSFTVSFSAVAGAHDECSSQPGMNVEVDYAVDNAGLVAGTPPQPFVDYPAGEETRCDYEVATLPASPASPSAGAVLRWQLERGADATTTLNGGSPGVAVSYTVGVVTFSPTVAITVPQYNGDDDTATQVDESTRNAFVGRTFEVSFSQSAGAPGGGTGSAPGGGSAGPTSSCETVTELYVVDGSGVAAPQDGTAPVLTHFPAGDTSAACAYDVTYPSSVGMAPALERVDTGLDAATSASELATGAAYRAARTMFVPEVTVAVPFVDFDDDEINDLNGETVVVSYVPVDGSDAGCPTDRSDTFTIAGGGSQGAGGEVMPPMSPVSLVDRPARVNARCRYTAQVPGSITPASGGTPLPSGTTVNLATDSAALGVAATGGAITIAYDVDSAPPPQQPATPQSPGTQPLNPQPPATPPVAGGGNRRPSAGGGGGGGSRSGGGGSGGASSSASSSAGSGASSSAGSSGPFVPSATQRVPVGVSLTLPADVFAVPTPVEVLVHAPGVCGADVTTFDGLAALVGIVYALDAAASGATAGATAEVIAAGARNLAQFAERGTQQRPCELRVTLLSAPVGCTLRATASAAAPATAPADAPPADAPPADAPALTDDAGRSYVELAWSEGAASLVLTPTLTCTPDSST